MVSAACAVSTETPNFQQSQSLGLPAPRWEIPTTGRVVRFLPALSPPFQKFSRTAPFQLGTKRSTCEVLRSVRNRRRTLPESRFRPMQNRDSGQDQRSIYHLFASTKNKLPFLPSLTFPTKSGNVTVHGWAAGDHSKRRQASGLSRPDFRFASHRTVCSDEPGCSATWAWTHCPAPCQ